MPGPLVNDQVLGLKAGNLVYQLLVTRQTACLNAELDGYSYEKYLSFLLFILSFPVQILFFVASTCTKLNIVGKMRVKTYFWHYITIFLANNVSFGTRRDNKV